MERLRQPRADERTVKAATLGVVKHDCEDDAVPQTECPIVKVIYLGKYLKRIGKHALILAHGLHTGLCEGHEVIWWRLAWRCDRYRAAPANRENLGGVIEMKSANDLPKYLVDPFRIEDLRYRAGRQMYASDLVFELL